MTLLAVDQLSCRRSDGTTAPTRWRYPLFQMSFLSCGATSSTDQRAWARRLGFITFSSSAVTATPAITPERPQPPISASVSATGRGSSESIVCIGPWSFRGGSKIMTGRTPCTRLSSRSRKRACPRKIRSQEWRCMPSRCWSMTFPITPCFPNCLSKRARLTRRHG